MPKRRSQLVLGRRGLLEHVVQQAGHGQRLVGSALGEEAGHRSRMFDERRAVMGAQLPGVTLGCELVSALEAPQLSPRQQAGRRGEPTSPGVIRPHTHIVRAGCRWRGAGALQIGCDGRAAVRARRATGLNPFGTGPGAVVAHDERVPFTTYEGARHVQDRCVLGTHTGRR